MGVSNYTPTGISHVTSVDFSKRSVNQPVHIVQYDKSLPILAVSLYNNGQLYSLSESMDVSIRLGKPDRTFVYNKALGCDSTRTIVYFEITEQMTVFAGEYYPVVEVKDVDKVANSSTIYLVIDRNPVQTDYIESTTEYKELVEYRDEALKAKEAAKLSETNAKASEEASKLSEINAKSSEEASKLSEINAKESEEASKLSEINAKSSEEASKLSEANAKVFEESSKLSETNAKASEEASKLSETNAKESEKASKLSETNAKESEEASKLSETKAKASEEASKLSETKAKASEEASKLSETNAKTSETNAKESETNAKASEEASKLSETNAKASETRAKQSETNVIDAKNDAVKYSNLSESYAVGTGNVIRENDAEDNAKKYCETAKSSEVNAKASEEASKLSETNAKESETNAVKYGNLSKSYAVGTDNVIRENDSEDNAKKYCETAKSSEVNAKQSETNAKAYLDEIVRKIQATNFEVDFTTGELIQTTDTDYVFTINQTTGNLEWEVTA